MGDRTAIEWADATVNFWWGCQEVSPGCDHCYAKTMAAYRPVGKPARIAKWGPHEERVPIWTAGILTQKLVNRAKREGRRLRVFTNSMSDFFDNAVDEKDRAWAWDQIGNARELDWLILTKRPQNITKMLPYWWGPESFGHVWLGASVENQEEADRRVPALLQVSAAVRFVSYEPALGPVDFSRWLTSKCLSPDSFDAARHDPEDWSRRLDWIIVGGESGSGARPFDVAWAHSTIEQCRAAGVACFVKQLGSRPLTAFIRRETWPNNEPKMTDRKGGNWDEWPDELRVREFPLLTPLDRRAITILAEREWEATRRKLEPVWKDLPAEARRVWLDDCERFIGRYIAIREKVA